MVYVFVAMFLALPVISIAWCISSSRKYLKAKFNPTPDNSEQYKEKIQHLRAVFVVSLIVALVSTGVVVGTIITFAIGIMYM